VVPGSAAEEAGLRVGDVITLVDGRPVSDLRTLAAVVRSRRVGDWIRVDFLRGGAAHHVEVTPKGRPQRRDGP
jgi:putative serine protease PepD